MPLTRLFFQVQRENQRDYEINHSRVVACRRLWRQSSLLSVRAQHSLKGCKPLTLLAQGCFGASSLHLSSTKNRINHLGATQTSCHPFRTKRGEKGGLDCERILRSEWGFLSFLLVAESREYYGFLRKNPLSAPPMAPRRRSPFRSPLYERQGRQRSLASDLSFQKAFKTVVRRPILSFQNASIARKNPIKSV